MRTRPLAWSNRFSVLLLSLLICQVTDIGAVIPVPLDTLLSDAPKPIATGHITMTRSTLPDISTTTVPRRPPPPTPPRLDDPATGERLFAAATHAARQGQRQIADSAIRDALIARPGDSRLSLWHVNEALRQRDPGAFVWHLPGAIRSVRNDPLAAPRLIVLAHQAALLLLAVFWTLLVIAGLAATWRSLAHDLTALLFRDPRHGLRTWTPLLLIGVVFLLRPGWLGALALLSIPVLLQVRGKVRGLFLATWCVSLVLSFPNWPALRDCLPLLDPDSETTLLVRAGSEDTSPYLIQDLRERMARVDDDDRRSRLRLALGVQEARRGRYTASSEHLRAVLAHRPQDVAALVGLANNSYYLSRFDEALRGYRQARELAPRRGEIPYNMAQIYLKKLFLPEAGQALEEARSLRFSTPGDSAAPRQAMDFAPTVYLELSRDDLRASARFERDNYPPLASIGAWNSFLGAFPLPLFLMLGGLLTVGLILIYWGRLQDDVRHCSMCNNEICRHCCRVLDGDVICQGCAETAERSRSEMVLATLLKNRSRAVGLSTTSRLVLLARMLPGAAHLAIGDLGCAVRRFALLTLAIYMISFGWAFDSSTTWSSPGLALPEELVHPAWLPMPAGMWPGLLIWPVAAGWILLGIAYLLALIDASRLRQRLPEQLIQMHVTVTQGPGRA